MSAYIVSVPAEWPFCSWIYQKSNMWPWKQGNWQLKGIVILPISASVKWYTALEKSLEVSFEVKHILIYDPENPQ